MLMYLVPQIQEAGIRLLCTEKIRILPSGRPLLLFFAFFFLHLPPRSICTYFRRLRPRPPALLQEHFDSLLLSVAPFGASHSLTFFDFLHRPAPPRPPAPWRDLSSPCAWFKRSGTSLNDSCMGYDLALDYFCAYE